jgi:hypothetical protein
VVLPASNQGDVVNRRGRSETVVRKSRGCRRGASFRARPNGIASASCYAVIGRKRTIAFILCMSRRTARPCALASGRRCRSDRADSWRSCGLRTAGRQSRQDPVYSRPECGPGPAGAGSTLSSPKVTKAAGTGQRAGLSLGRGRDHRQAAGPRPRRPDRPNRLAGRPRNRRSAR